MKARLPDFIGIGPARTGTTWLHEVLRHHINLPHREKEVHFFDYYYGRGFEWYESRFTPCSPQVKRGEFTPNYFQFEPALTRIACDIPDCKIIFGVREPASRLYSLYKLWRFHGMLTDTSFEDALWNNLLKVEGNRYTHYLNQWLNAFGRNQVLIAVYDDLEADPQSYLNRITDFIGIKQIALTPQSANRIYSFSKAPRRPFLARRLWRLHLKGGPNISYRLRAALRKVGLWQFCFSEGQPYPPLDPRLRKTLREHFRPEVEALEELIGRDLSSWKS
jgi:Sulfotransferase domain